MYRTLNSPKEMLRRLAYLLYMVAAFATAVLMVVALASPGWRSLIRASSSFFVLTAIRQAGYRWLDFERLFKSFPSGCALDAVPEPIRTEVECLVEEFHAAHTDWVRRAAIRRRLLELEELQPEIVEAYSEDLRDVLAA